MTDAASRDIAGAAAALANGDLVAFPTETVYGLGADAENPAAVAKIYAAKGRPQDHPVIVHVAPGADIDYWTTEVPDEARALARAFWPGPLTLILKRNAHIPDAVSGGQDTVGIRCPSHPVAMQLLQAFKEGKGGVAAPSANKFGNVSPTTAQHVHDEFGDDPRLAAILDGGSSQVGIESTILDLSRLATHGPVLLRPGHITAQQIADVIGTMPRQPDQAAPRASGTLESHYAPKAPVALLPTGDIEKTLAELTLRGRCAALIHYSPFALSLPNVALPAEPKGYAYGVYAALRAMDQQQVELILVETPPSDDAWLGVNDRLRRAAFGSTGIIERFLKS
ncbi:L-threonylcarbamoyladenylate synthase [Duganella sp. CF458]|uniref:L-threonylcarbamoyladenylate synthase n=1 Tax=Duganella sp. CF458 TaxID=1884368 RepID=UPI0008ED6E3C|nr:L-threonylcarbamoyladenylate synthase [Duganella sp. CF458]SFF56867.1 L-threonylcarbamoyladenylate synthase [Duganella sp. CF458]